MKELFKNATLLTMEEENSYIGDMLIENGKIIELADEINKEADVVYDLTGKYIMPGIIDAHSHIGIIESSMGFEGEDVNEDTDPITPELRAIDAINPFDPAFKEAREHGVTTVVTGPGSANVLGGQFLAMKTVGNCIDDMVIKEPFAVKAALGENPKRVYHSKEKAPSTRMATAALLRETLYKARKYAKKSEKDDFDFSLEALVDVIEKRIPLKIHAHRADDIMTAVRIAKEFDINYTIDHCTEGHLIADFLKRENAKVILGPLLLEPCKIELKNMTMKAPKILFEKGIKPVLMSDHPEVGVKYLIVCAALAAREGLPQIEALRMITKYPSEVLGFDSFIGSLAVGKDADFAVYSGHPLEYMSIVEQTYINGENINKH